MILNPKLCATPVIEKSGQEESLAAWKLDAGLVFSLGLDVTGGDDEFEDSVCWIKEGRAGHAAKGLGLMPAVEAVDGHFDMGLRSCGLNEYTGCHEEITL